MNVYAVISGPILYQEYVDPEIGGPWEEYTIAELVAAPSRGRAKWLAWQADGFQKYIRDINDMPNFSAKLVRKNEPWSEGICSEQEHLWAWGIAEPWKVSEATLVENYLAWCAESLYGDDE